MAKRASGRLTDVFDGDWSPALVRRLAMVVVGLAVTAGVAVWAVGDGDPQPDGAPPGQSAPAPIRPRLTFGSSEGLGSPRPTMTAMAMTPTRRDHPAPDMTTPRPPRRTTPPPAGPTARYVLTSSWHDGFVPNVIVRNPAGEPARWEIRLSYPSHFQVRVVNSWNTTVRSGLGVLVFTGGPLAPGAEITMGFQATKARPEEPAPTSCTINGVRC